jgi:hypothetical protein
MILYNREKKIQERPYRRLLSAITTTVGQEGDSFGASPPVSKDVRKEADETVVTVFSALTPSSPKSKSVFIYSPALIFAESHYRTVLTSVFLFHSLL